MVNREVETALARRDAGWARVRATTWAGVLLGLLLTAVFTVAAAGSTHAKRVVTHVVRAKRRVPAVVAPAPPLVSAAAPASQQPPPAPAATPAPAPAPAPSPPVVVSGGS